MMGPRQVAQVALFHEFTIEGFVPQDYPVRGTDRLLNLSDGRPLLAPFYSSHGRPANDPELIIRVLLLGDAGLVARGSQVRAAHPGLRQIEANRRHILAR